MKIIKTKILNFKANLSNFFKHLIVSQITFNKCNFSHFIHNDAFNNFYIFIFTGLRNVFAIIFANAKVTIVILISFKYLTWINFITLFSFEVNSTPFENRWILTLNYFLLKLLMSWRDFGLACWSEVIILFVG